MGGFNPIDIQVPNFVGILQAAQQYRANQLQMAAKQQEMARQDQVRSLTGQYLQAPPDSIARQQASQQLQSVAPEEFLGLQQRLSAQETERLQRERLQSDISQQPLKTQALEADVTGAQQQNRLRELQLGQFNRRAALEEQNTRSEIALRGAQARKLLSESAAKGTTSQLPPATRAKLAEEVYASNQQATILGNVLAVPTFNEQFKLLAKKRGEFLSARASVNEGSLSQADRNFLADRQAVFEPLQLINSELLKEQIGTGRSIVELKGLDKVITGESTDPITARIAIARAADRAEKAARTRSLALSKGIPDSGPEYRRFVAENEQILNEPPSRELVGTVYNSLLSAGRSKSDAEKEVERIFPSIKALRQQRPVNNAAPSRPSVSSAPIGAPGFPQGYGMQAPPRQAPVQSSFLLELMGLPPVPQRGG